MGLPELPDHAVMNDGYLITTLVAVPRWVYAWTTTEVDSGLSWLSVYRSTYLRDYSVKLDPIREMMLSGNVLAHEVSPDGDMIFRKASLTMYSIPMTPTGSAERNAA